MIVLDLLSLLYVFAGARYVYEAWQRRKELTDAQLTGSDRRLLAQLAFFVLIPPGVFLHELGHALATLQLGGAVGDFHYALFWGYIIPVGTFTRLGEWWIALSGNLVSIVYGLLALPLLLIARQTWQKYLLLSFARVQLGWALVGYPLITLLGFEGDWRTIYDPSTWVVGLPFFAFHVALVLALFAWNRSASVQSWEVSLYAEAGDRLSELNRRLTTQPHDRAALLERGALFLHSGMVSRAQADFNRILKHYPGDAAALLNLAEIELQRKQAPAAERHYREALARAGDSPQLAAWAHFRLATILYERGDRQGAVGEFDRAIAANGDEPLFHYWRGMAFRSLGKTEFARADFRQALRLSDRTDPRRAQWERELAEL